MSVLMCSVYVCDNTGTLVAKRRLNVGSVVVTLTMLLNGTSVTVGSYSHRWQNAVIST